MRLALILFLMLLSNSVFAQETKEEFCSRLAVHEQDHVQGADYVPGVDVHGKSVVSADLSGASPPLLDPTVIPVEIDLVTRYGLSVPVSVELAPGVARFEIFSDGRVIYNGQDLTQRIEAFCSEPDGDYKESAAQGHGQEIGNTVPSAFTKWEEGKDVIKGSYPENIPEKPRYNN